METHASPTKPIETIEDVARPDVMNDDSAAVTTVPAVNVSLPVKREANGSSREASEGHTVELALEEPGDIEVTDDEEALEILTGQ